MIQEDLQIQARHATNAETVSAWIANVAVKKELVCVKMRSAKRTGKQGKHTVSVFHSPITASMVVNATVKTVLTS